MINNRNKPKIISFLLLLVMLAAILIAFMSCEQPGKADDPEKNSNEPLSIVAGGISDYTIIRPDKANAHIKELASKLKNAVSSKYGVMLQYNSDWVKDISELPADGKEILIGNTNRPETAAAREMLDSSGYIIQAVNNRIVIAASNDELLDFAVDAFIENYVNAADESEMKIEAAHLNLVTMTDYIRYDWELKSSIPMYNGGTMAKGVYNAGPGLANDQRKTTSEDSYMQIVYDTNEEEYNNYIKKCNTAGFETVFSNKTEQNLYTQLKSPTELIYVYFTAKSSEVRIIDDNSSVPLTAFNYTSDSITEGSTEVYQYGLYYDPANGHSATTTNCGMFYIVKLSDNSLIMIDGGDLLQCSDEALEGMWSFMKEITGTAENEKVKIAAWYITHAHGDHVGMCTKMLNRHHDDIELQRMMYNMPSYQVHPTGYDTQTFAMKNAVLKYYPDLLFVKLQTGQKITLGSVTFDVLYTQQDAVTKDKATDYSFGDFNCTSSILKMSFDGKTMMWFGDTNVETEALVTKLYSASVFKADIVQIAHHCFNYLSTLYKWVDADYAYLPNSYFGGHTSENLPKLNDVFKYMTDKSNIRYEDETNGLRVTNGKIEFFLNRKLVGGEYDNSGAN